MNNAEQSQAHHEPFVNLSDSAVPPRVVDVSVILPTFNEAENIRTMILAVQGVFGDTFHYEIIVVDDDSPDETWRLVDELAAADARIRCNRRVDRKGLSSAIVDGLSQAEGQRLVVMDADGQHDQKLVPQLVAALDQAEIAVASRYIDGGSVAGWGLIRRWGSTTMSTITRLVLGIAVTDPMSGFFAIRREVFHGLAKQLRPRGYKALLEIIYRAPKARITEIPLIFGVRQGGKSKLGANTVTDLLVSLVELRTGRLISGRFLRYAAVGVSGVAIQYAAFFLIVQSMTEQLSLALAILVAMLSNYLVNNMWTFRDRALNGMALIMGFLRFLVVSGVGAFINHSVTIRFSDMTDLSLTYSMLVGIIIATTWNYHLNRGITWRLWERGE